MAVDSLAEYYICLRTLANAWALAGNYKVESLEKPGTQVLMMPLEAAMNYADRALRMAIIEGEGSRSWLERKDLLTRGHMCTYLRRGWPAGEALAKALGETHLDWKSPQGSARSDWILQRDPRPRSAHPGGPAERKAPPRDKARSTAMCPPSQAA